MNTKRLALTILSFLLGILLALPGFSQQAAPAGTVGAKVPIGPALTAEAKNPTPPANATQATSIGKGSAAMKTKNSSGDTDSFWAEEIDVDADGNVEETDILWDDEDKALFFYYEDDFTCNNGATGSGAILIGLNAAGNPRKMPVGSGFYAVSLDKGECGAQAAALWGCKFDQNGNPTACGVAVLDEKTDTLVIEAVSQ
jgi:hypothetical protein